MIFSFLPFAAAFFSLSLAAGSLLLKRSSPARWCFFAGMAVLGIDSLITGLESIKGYHDIFNSPEGNFGPDKHQGASSSFLAVVKDGRWVRLTEPLVF